MVYKLAAKGGSGRSKKVETTVCQLKKRKKNKLLSSISPVYWLDYLVAHPSSLNYVNLNWKLC